MKLSFVSKTFFANFSIDAASVLSEIPIASTSLDKISSSPPSIAVFSVLSYHLGISWSLNLG